LKPVFDPSAEDFLDAIRRNADYRLLSDHIFDEIRQLGLDPLVDLVDKFAFPVPSDPDRFYRICWGHPVIGRSFWYIYDPDYDADTLRIINIGEAGVESPFLSRR
jgi:hypothetical protein